MNRSKTLVTAFFLSIMIGTSASATPENEEFKTHSGWFKFVDSNAEETAIFRKYVNHRNGFKNVLNLHCLPGSNKQPYISIDLGMSNYAQEAIDRISKNPRSIAFSVHDGNKLIPGVEVSRSIIYYQKDPGRPWFFDEALTLGEFSFDIIYENGKHLILKLADLPVSANIAQAFLETASPRYNSLGVKISHVSTYDLVRICS